MAEKSGQTEKNIYLNHAADFEIIDAHIHPFLNEASCLTLYDTPRTPEDLVYLMKQQCISRCCGSVIHPVNITDFKEIHELNQEALAFRDRFPDFYFPGCVVHAAFPEESCRELEDMYRNHGVRWLGELVCYVTGVKNFFCQGMFPIFELAQDLQMPVNIHQADIADIEKIAENFPKLPVVMAHPDEQPTYMARLAQMEKYPNLYQDLSGTGLFRWGMLKYGIKRTGADRFLFGSDFPICNIGMNIGAILSEGIRDEDLQKIFSGNFLRLVNL